MNLLVNFSNCADDIDRAFFFLDYAERTGCVNESSAAASSDIYKWNRIYRN